MHSVIIKPKNLIFNTLKSVLYKEKPLIAVWWEEPEVKNWGDALNPVLIKNISGKEPILYNEIINFENLPVYSVVGSILENYSNKNLVIWGQDLYHHLQNSK